MFVCRSASLALLISTAGLAQQDPETLAKAVAVWVDSDQVDAALLAQTVKLVLDDKAGLQWLGAQQPPTLARHDERASKAIAALSLHVLLGFLERAKNSGMVFRGQYEPLRALLPVATNTLFELLLRTPDWFPFSERSRLLPAIRDLQPECPDDRRLTGVVEIAENTGLESEAFRVEVACLLWQWGRKEYLMPCIDELKQQTMEGDAENRLVALRALAKLWYEVAEYQKAAMVHSSLKRRRRWLDKSSLPPIGIGLPVASRCSAKWIVELRRCSNALRCRRAIRSMSRASCRANCLSKIQKLPSCEPTRGLSTC